jgi:hypothetical protein
VLRSTRTPSPQPRLSRNPESAFPILVQRAHPLAETVAAAIGAAALDRAQGPSRTCVPASPYRSFTIRNERLDAVSIKLRILGQLTVCPTGKTLKSPDPEGSVARGEQTSNPVVGEVGAGRKPGHTPNAIEAQQTEFRTQPQITVARLRKGRDPLPLGEAFAEDPFGVRVLTDVETRIQRGRTRAGHQGDAQRDQAWRDNCFLECVSPVHDPRTRRRPV